MPAECAHFEDPSRVQSVQHVRAIRVHSRTMAALVVALINAYAAAADDANSLAAGDGTRAKPGVGGVDSADVAVLVSANRGDTCVDNDVLVLACCCLNACARCERTNRVHTNLLCNRQRFNSLRQGRHVVQSSCNIVGHCRIYSEITVSSMCNELTNRWHSLLN